jgi:putative DNA primase/helicase
VNNANGLALGTVAEGYAANGYRVFRLAPRAKVPTAGSSGLLEATTDLDVVVRWWRDEPFNIGINCDGILVLDVDRIDGKTKPNPWLTDERARELSAAPTQRTWSGGHQFFFRQPEGKHWRNTESDIAPNIDTRGYGGYVVAPPSFVREGKRTGYYQWGDGCELEVAPADLPEPPAWLVEVLDAIEAHRGESNGATSETTVSQNGEPIPSGKRDGTLASLAGTMRKRGMAPDEIEAALLAINRNRCRPPLPEADVKRIANSIGRYEAGKLNGHAQPFTTPRIVKLSEVTPRTVRWLWPSRVALGKLTLIAGEPGLGKSQLTLDMVARVTTGNPWPDDVLGVTFNQAGSAILLSAEDDIEDTIVPRLIAAGADLNFVTAIQGVDFQLDSKEPAKQRGFNLEKDMPALEQALNAQPDARLVVIDPIAAYMGKTDSHRDADTRGTLAPLAQLAAERNVAVVYVMHLNKSAGAKAGHRVSGSGAFIAAARAAWLVAPDKADPKRLILAQMKNNLAPNPGGLAFGIVQIGDAPALAWEQGIVSTTADELLADDKKTKTRDREREWLKKRLADGPLDQATIRSYSDETGFSWRTIQRAATDLGVEKFRSGFGKGGRWSWRLPGIDDPSSQEVASYEESEF